jgi:hypothetical protein
MAAGGKFGSENPIAIPVSGQISRLTFFIRPGRTRKKKRKSPLDRINEDQENGGRRIIQPFKM